MAGAEIRDFDGFALFAALDAQRQERGLSWQGVADEIWLLSAALNDERRDHPISASTIRNIEKRGDTTCQHALFMLRWLGRAPESFLDGAPTTAKRVKMPGLDGSRRPRWHLKRLYAAMDEQRRAEAMTWPELAAVLRCTPSQLTGLKTARFATGMGVAMRIVQWLGRPASDFVYAATW